MGEKILSALGTVIGYTVILIGSYEVVCFGFNRCAEIIEAGGGVLDEAWNNLRNR